MWATALKFRLFEHALSIVLVTVAVWGGVRVYGNFQARQADREFGSARAFFDSPATDFRTPFRSALFDDLLDVYYPGRNTENRSVSAAARRYRAQSESLDARRHALLAQPLTAGRVGGILVMYGKFLTVFWIVLGLTYYGAHTLGVWRYVKRMRETEIVAGMPLPRGNRPAALFQRYLCKTLGIGAQFVLFSPAFVIAYSIRTQVNTDTIVFLVLLVVVSNGLLITYANKFFNFLETESRKGYVQTARVKNLNNRYKIPGGISLKAVFALRKRFDGHVFEHIYRNARLQYLSTVKEQAAFLVTGLVITEMALNIHGYLSYELLRQLLYRNVPTVAFITLLIFYTVKMAEIFVDIVLAREERHYSNAVATTRTGRR